MKHTAIYYFRKRELKKNRKEKTFNQLLFCFVIINDIITVRYCLVQNGFMLNCTCINIMSTFKGQKHGLDTHCIRFRFSTLVEFSVLYLI